MELRPAGGAGGRGCCEMGAGSAARDFAARWGAGALLRRGPAADLGPIHGVAVHNGLRHPREVGVVARLVECQAAVEAADAGLRQDEGKADLVDDLLRGWRGCS